MQVLIADDDPVSLRVLEKALRRRDYEVTAVRDGAEAWARYQEGDFALVITDWVMPEVDGLELTRRIRSARRAGYAYVVLLTSRREKEDLLEGLEAGADDYLAKPFDPEELQARLRAADRVLALQERLEKRNRKLQSAYEEIRSAHRRMKDDLDAAASIQRAMLPTTIPDFPDTHFAWRFRPCTELAGDVLNVIAIGDHLAAFYLLDVSGHGVQAALTAVGLSRALMPHPGQSSLLVRENRDGSEREHVAPAEVARRLNLRFTARPMGGLFFTLFYGILDLEARALTYVSAGHPAAVRLTADGTPSNLAATGPPIGAVRDSTWREGEVTLEPGDRLYVYSDGLTEGQNPQGAFFGSDRLVDLLRRSRDVPLGDALDRLVAGVEAFTGDAELKDDASILALEIDRAE